MIAQERGIIQASWTRVMSRPKDPKLPFPHKNCGDESASNILEKCCVSIQRILLHMFESRLHDGSVNDVTIKALEVHLLFFRLFAQLPFVLARALCEGVTHGTRANSIRQSVP
jgi:hypothetical protein